jgi:hypothetical protein
LEAFASLAEIFASSAALTAETEKITAAAMANFFIYRPPGNSLLE